MITKPPGDSFGYSVPTRRRSTRRSPPLEPDDGQGFDRRVRECVTEPTFEELHLVVEQTVAVEVRGGRGRRRPSRCRLRRGPRRRPRDTAAVGCGQPSKESATHTHRSVTLYAARIPRIRMVAPPRRRRRLDEIAGHVVVDDLPHAAHQVLEAARPDHGLGERRPVAALRRVRRRVTTELDDVPPAVAELCELLPRYNASATRGRWASSSMNRLRLRQPARRSM